MLSLRRTRLGGVMFVSCLMGLHTLSAQRPLSFEDRIKAQEAIERVYYNHRIWPKENPQPKPPFEEMVPRVVIEERVRTYLDESAALEVFWNRPVTNSQLQAEIDRMGRQTRDAAVLKELFNVLGDDPYRIAECLGRPALADRLVRDWYAVDPRFHEASRTAAEAVLAQWRSDGPTPAPVHRSRRWRLARRDEAGSVVWQDGGDKGLTIEQSEFDAARRNLGSAGSGPYLREERDRFVVVEVLDSDAHSIEGISYEVTKRPLSEWLKGLGSLPPREATDVAEDVTAFVMPTVGTGIPSSPDKGWLPSSLGGEIDPKVGHTTVWTGTEMIVWGGFDGNMTVASGGRYTPATDTWVATSTDAICPNARMDHSAVWTGSEMIVWGGYDYHYGFTLNTGARYAPETDTWAPMSTDSGCPQGRAQHIAVWTGTKMIVWGGVLGHCCDFTNTGGCYDPVTDGWTATSRTGSCPTARTLSTAVWTGSRMIVWGGMGLTDRVVTFNSGGIYDPAADSWTATPINGACPAPRCSHTAAWTGTEMIVWGGLSGASDTSGYLASGGRFNLSTGTWAPVSQGLACPAARALHTAVWSGTKMIIWGGYGAGIGDTRTGGLYTPATDTWTATSTAPGVPSARHSHSAIWTGTEMIVWGGTTGCPNCSSSNAPESSSGRYNPSTDSWVPTSTGNGAPERRYLQSTVWTGSEMIVWGGDVGMSPNADYSNTGGRYNPASDSWTPTSTSGSCPTGRGGQTAVWTGTEMIVWGGIYYLNTGGRYNPVSNTWTATSSGAGTPSGRDRHTAVWTGTQMIIWGGETVSGPNALNDGARYDPSHDAWLPTSQAKACPEPRLAHSAVWTGSRMIVWGGFAMNQVYYNDGASYDPSTDSWSTIAASPSDLTQRGNHTAVWTGRVMIIWGGGGIPHAENTGGCYDPAVGRWTLTSVGDGCPHGRFDHSAVWTGSRMIVWGGTWWDNGTHIRNDGGLFDPVANTWESMSIGANLPSPRSGHSAVWTGSDMIVWGGYPMTATGGVYHPGVSPPSVSNVSQKGSPFRLFVEGGDFQPGIQVYLADQLVPWTNVVIKSATTLLIKGASRLFPKEDVYVDIRLVNPDGGETTVQYDRKTKSWRPVS